MKKNQARYKRLEILDPGEWDNEEGPKNWYAVAGDLGIIAYFGNVEEAGLFIETIQSIQHFVYFNIKD